MTLDWRMERKLLSFVSPSNSLLSQTWTLEGLFELTRCLSRAINLASYAASGTTEKQGHHQLYQARPGAPREARFSCPSTPMKTTDANLYCEFTKHKLE